jgi:guanine nucleotide-binding protein subunit alpha
LFLNKVDLLRAKLEAGVSFGHYVVSYATKPNDYGSVSTCEPFFCPMIISLTTTLDLRKKFTHIHKQYSPQERNLYCHLTAMTVSNSHSVCLAPDEDIINTGYLRTHEWLKMSL